MKLESREISAQTGFKCNSWRTEDIFVAPAVLGYEMNNYEGESIVHTDLRILYCILKPRNMCSFVMAFIANVDIFSEGQEIKRKILPPPPLLVLAATFEHALWLVRPLSGHLGFDRANEEVSEDVGSGNSWGSENVEQVPNTSRKVMVRLCVSLCCALHFIRLNGRVHTLDPYGCVDMASSSPPPPPPPPPPLPCPAGKM